MYSLAAFCSNYVCGETSSVRLAT